MKILITGASGFIGSFIVEEALNRGYETWAAVRGSSSRAYLQDARIHFIELDLSSKERLKEQLRGHEFDYVVHAAGVTKCLRRSDFFRVNTEGTKNLVNAIRELDMPLHRFVYISSLSVFGAIKEKQPYHDIREDDTPRPNTAYGQSKLAAERWLDALNAEIEAREKREQNGACSSYAERGQGSTEGQARQKREQNGACSSYAERGQGSTEGQAREETPFPFVVLRPTGVYGPRERDYFMMVKSIKQHTDFAVGFRRQDITFVYVTDVVQAVFLTFDHGHYGRKYFLSDGQVYQSTTFSNLIHQELGRPWWIRIKAPVWVLRIVAFCGDLVAHVTGKPTALNNDKYHILKQRNWRCDIQPAIDELGYKPQVQLAEGVRRAVEWYKNEGWV